MGSKFKAELSGKHENKSLGIMEDACYPIPPPFCFCCGPYCCIAELDIKNSPDEALEFTFDGNRIYRDGRGCPECFVQDLEPTWDKYEVDSVVHTFRCGCAPGKKKWLLYKDGTIAAEPKPNLVLGTDRINRIALVDRTNDADRVIFFKHVANVPGALNLPEDIEPLPPVVEVKQPVQQQMLQGTAVGAADDTSKSES